MTQDPGVTSPDAIPHRLSPAEAKLELFRQAQQAMPDNSDPVAVIELAKWLETGNPEPVKDDGPVYNVLFHRSFGVLRFHSNPACMRTAWFPAGEEAKTGCPCGGSGYEWKVLYYLV